MESPLVIKAEGLKKRYRLGQAGGGTLSEDLGAWLSRLRGKGDPRGTLDADGDSQRSATKWLSRTAPEVQTLSLASSMS